MTGYGPPGSQPPPPGGYGAPQGGGYGPPPGGGYGPPPGGGYGAPGYGPAAGGGVNLSAVNPLDWAAIAAGVLALIFSFFNFYEYKPSGDGVDLACRNPTSQTVKDACDGIDNSAWHGFFGWFGVLLALVAAVLVALAIFVPQLSLPVPARVLALGGYALGFLLVLIALFVVPDGDYEGRTIDSGSSDVDAGHSFSYWIVLALVLVGAVVTFLSFQRSGGSLSNPFGSGGSTGQSAGGYPGYGAPQGPPPGYGQQPPQGPPPGYGQQPPQGPPPGYGQQPPQGPPPGYGQQPPQGPPPGYGQQPPQGPPPGYGR